VAYTVILHIPSADPVLAEMEELPKPNDSFVVVRNMRTRDGNQLSYIDPDAETFILPWHRLTFIEVLPSEDERAKVLKFFRE
jgi:hypothetical protein